MAQFVEVAGADFWVKLRGQTQTSVPWRTVQVIGQQRLICGTYKTRRRTASQQNRFIVPACYVHIRRGLVEPPNNVASTQLKRRIAFRRLSASL